MFDTNYSFFRIMQLEEIISQCVAAFRRGETDVSIGDEYTLTESERKYILSEIEKRIRR